MAVHLNMANQTSIETSPFQNSELFCDWLAVSKLKNQYVLYSAFGLLPLMFINNHRQNDFFHAKCKQLKTRVKNMARRT